MTALSDSFGAAAGLLLSNDPALWAIVGRSFAVSLLACLLASCVGLPLGAWLGVARFRGRAGVLALLNTVLALPSVVVGLLVYLLLSRSGPLGFLGWLFSFKAMVLAQAVLVLPVVAALTRQCVEDAQNLHGEQIQSLGAGAALRSLILAWDERFALLTVLIAALGRAVSEVGAVMIVGGNIDGFTRVMTTAIALETSKGDLALALALGLILLLAVLLLNLLISLLKTWRERQDGQSAASAAVTAPTAAVTAPTALRGHHAMAVAALLQLHSAQVRYGHVTALDSVTLRLAPGERLALLGSNGSGKSSLLRLLHGLATPSAGRVQLEPGLRQAMLFQRPFVLRTSCANNVALGLWLAGMQWRTAQAAALPALARVGLQDLAERNAKTLSGGQQQRLALARAWALQPDVLLLDEPTANLDPQAKREVENLLAELSGGMTLVFASHNLGQVKRLATRVLYLERGQVLADLPVARFFEGDLLQERYPEAYLFAKSG